MADVSMEQHKEGGEMMETETTRVHQQQHHQEVASNSNGSQSDAIRDLLAMARHLINQGKPSQALQAVSFSHLFFSLSPLDFLLASLFYFCVLHDWEALFFTLKL